MILPKHLNPCCQVLHSTQYCPSLASRPLLKVSVCCDYQIAHHAPLAVVIYCSSTPITPSNTLLFLFSALHLSDFCKHINSISPCQICNIKGVHFGSGTNYVPLQWDKIPGATPCRYISSNLSIRTHKQLMVQAHNIKMVPNNATHEWLAKEHGIKGIPVLSSISSIGFPSSFPFNFMHLIWENLIPNLIEFWTGKFKDLDHQGKGYFIKPHIWNKIGAATAACKVTVLAAFGAPLKWSGLKWVLRCMQIGHCILLPLCYTEGLKVFDTMDTSCNLLNFSSFV